MRWKYCSFCANLSIKKETDGSYSCPKCDWRGTPLEGDMEVINVKAKSYIKGTKWISPSQMPRDINDPEGFKPKSEDEEKSENGGFISTAKIRPSTASGKVPKNKELMERLKQRGIMEDFS